MKDVVESVCLCLTNNILNQLQHFPAYLISSLYIGEFLCRNFILETCSCIALGKFKYYIHRPAGGLNTSIFGYD
jgi:hypothetical protein